MLLTLMLPPGLDLRGETAVVAVHAVAGAALRPGAKILDFSVDLSAGVAHDCPPVSHYRLIVRETAWLRRLFVGTGDALAGGIGLLSTGPDEPLDAAPARAARVTVASILFHAEGWGARS